MTDVKEKLPDWIEARYDILWDEFGEKSFNISDAAKILEEKKKNRVKQIPVFLSELRKAGWLKANLDPDDARRTIYTLMSKEKIIGDIFSIKKEKLSRSDIEGILKKAADLIRTRVDYKFILILLFLKRISDKWELEYKKAYNEALEDGFSKEKAEEEAKNAAYHDFDLPEDYLWDNIRKDVSTLPEKFSKAMKTISEQNPELKDILENVDFIQFASSSENSEILRQLVELFSEKKLHHVSPDILGDAYEWILRYFAPQKAKEGEVYTPREVIRLLVEILKPKPGESVYDPALGSNGMLIGAYDYIKEKKGKSEANKLFLYGQEASQSILALGRMNLYIHDIKNAHVLYGDSLRFPKFKEGDGVKQFDVVIANPPWNQDGYPEEVLKKGEFWKQRFTYGFNPKQSADWAWAQHMLASANDKNGRVGLVIDTGCLFRGGKEKVIRSRVINKDLIECIILLPEKLFYNTGAPGALMFFNKNKNENLKGKVLFINASDEYEKHSDVRKLNILSNKNIDKIVKVYKNFEEIKGFSKIVSIDKLIDDEFNLNVTLYVFPEEEIVNIDVNKEFRELLEIDEEIHEIQRKIEEYIGEVFA